MKFLLPMILLFLITGCNLISPAQLILRNGTDENLEIITDRPDYEKFTLEPDQYENLLLFPGKIKMTVRTDYFSRDYDLDLPWQTRTELTVKLDDH